MTTCVLACTCACKSVCVFVHVCARVCARVCVLMVSKPLAHWRKILCHCATLPSSPYFSFQIMIRKEKGLDNFLKKYKLCFSKTQAKRNSRTQHTVRKRNFSLFFLSFLAGSTKVIFVHRPPGKPGM